MLQIVQNVTNWVVSLTPNPGLSPNPSPVREGDLSVREGNLSVGEGRKGEYTMKWRFLAKVGG
jgi:hypothetical protein